MRGSLTVLLMIICLILLPSCLYAESKFDSLPYVRDLYPLTALHYSSAPRSARLIEPRSVVLDGSILLGNTNAIRDNYLVDAETRDFRVILRSRSYSNREYSLELPVVYRGHGATDSMINGWHDFWGLPEGHRDMVPDDQYAIRGTTDAGDTFSLPDSGVAAGNAVFGVRQSLFENEARTFLLTFDTRFSLPTATKTMGHAGIDTFAGLSASWWLGRTVLHSGSGILLIGDTEISNIEYARWRNESYIAAEYHFSSWSLYGSLIATSKVIDNIPDHPNYSGFFDLGAAMPVSNAASVIAGIREEINSGNGALDIGLNVMVRWQFN